MRSDLALRWGVVLVLVLVLTAACGASGGDGALEDPLAGGDPSRGADLFAFHCAGCHGAELDGSTVGPPLIHELYVPSHHADLSFLIAVQRGVEPHHWQFGRMPAVPSLEVEHVADIVAFVRQEQRAAGLID